MEILMFLIGFIAGCVCVLFISNLSRKNTQRDFENIANRVLKENSKELSDISEEKLKNVFELFKTRIEVLEKTSKENFEAETKNFLTFDNNIKNFMEAGQKISADTNALVNVMRSDNKTSGRWGEIVLERVLESSGLRKGQEYDVQSGTSDGRPDATVYLPEERCIYVDSKTSFASWDGYINSEDKDEKDMYLKKFVESTKTHIKNLSDKYTKGENTTDYVLMFIPIESCYAMMFCEDAALWNYAWEKGVMPVSPSTLLAALKTINSFFIIKRQKDNVDEITSICERMIDKVIALLKDVKDLKGVYNSIITKLDGKDNIISQLTRMVELGAKGKKDKTIIPEIPEKLSEN